MAHHNGFHISGGSAGAVPVKASAASETFAAGFSGGDTASFIKRLVDELRSHPGDAKGYTLLGIANLAFWQIFIAADMLMVGYVTTSLHWLFAASQVIAARAAPSPAAPRALAL